MKNVFTIFMTLLVLSSRCFGNFESCKNAGNTADVALVLSIDVSQSIDADEMLLQMQGYINAFNDAEILSVLKNSRSVAIGIVVWSEYSLIIHSLIKIESMESIRSIQKNLLKFQIVRERLGGSTYIDVGINEAISLLDNTDIQSYKKIIDISGDGWTTGSHLLRKAVTKAIEKNIEINGLPIEDIDTPKSTIEQNLEFLRLKSYQSMTDYYKREVITPYGFTETATTFKDFGDAIKRKIRRELSPLLF